MGGGACPAAPGGTAAAAAATGLPHWVQKAALVGSAAWHCEHVIVLPSFGAGGQWLVAVPV
jgi:hypothetical protein